MTTHTNSRAGATAHPSVRAPGARYVYDLSEGNAGMRALLGGKGAGVAEMQRIGLPVPDGFTVTTAACVAAMEDDGAWPGGLWDEILTHLATLERRTGRTLGAAERPLLVSVRSGAVVSMPGMMDTVLNLGMSDRAAQGLAAESDDPRFAWDTYRRFVQMYGEVVEGVPGQAFEDELTALKDRRGVRRDAELTADDLRELVKTFRGVVRRSTGHDLPTDPHDQLRRAVDAVFGSWNSPRARVYRELNEIPDDLGTAVNVMQMVFGNKGDTSATGVCFTRNPATGARERYGEFLLDAQGEDVVAGTRTPRRLPELESVLPGVYTQLLDTLDRLEQHYQDMQDVEFTIDDGTLYLLQVRTGKRTAAAALRVARDLVAEGVIDRPTALRRIDPAQLDQLLHPTLDPAQATTPLTHGLNASPGAAVGTLVFDADTAAERGGAGEDVVLVRWETTPDDIHGVAAAQGVLTAHGGMTSHAAVVARGMGKPCVAGAGELRIDVAARTLAVGDTVLTEADTITVDGTTGYVYPGALPLVPPQVTDDFATVLGWADDVRRLGVRANADTGEDAVRARELGAEGVGLCRTEHMFMATDRLPVVQRMILADTTEDRQAALDELLPVQQADFEEIFTAMTGLPVAVRLIDPPLHEFLPDLVEQSLLVQRLEADGTPGELERARTLLAHVRRLSEANPMLGTRGVRLSLLHPEIGVMQTRAIVRAALAVRGRGLDPRVEIMVPLVGYAEELRRMREIVVATADGELDAAGVTDLDYRVGTMIELPRAALTAGEIAEHADFFSFGTNDLTQTTVGISRDDAEGSFLAAYLEAGVVRTNPFASLDADGVGELVRIGVERGLRTRPGLETGVCGEHGGDPASIALLDELGVDYVSCSPYRVPVARLAAAQARLDGAPGEA
ncbi:pyruvate, phosphate dikinase [Promicromonospora sp. MEB111]|uniref:pyruvate, phosphate dikinase n=1 Tax=Promicromonospora sp. MEB111 TaxID=3040301 RepID=UPI00254DDF86|nr:pyruvate, phosphate dikinase [Promicromonospora sp. MEB111]